MAYDAESDRVVLFVGDSLQSSIGETWAYDYNANRWTNMTTGSGPPRRAGPAMAYDSESDRVVLFGGCCLAGGGFLADTWTYDFNTNAWANLDSFPKPSPRYGHSMAYDAESNRVILFGSDVPGGSSNETWAYDSTGNTWTNQTGPDGPSGRFHHAMAYDPGVDRILLFGGSTGRGFSLRSSDETWTYDANTNVWTNAISSGGHPARTRHAMVYDSGLAKIVLFGGFGGFAVEPPVLLTDETWSYDADTNVWTNLTTAGGPSPRMNHVMAYDTESSRIVLFGGILGRDLSRETWVYASAPSGVEVSLLTLTVIVVTVAVVAAVAALLIRRKRSSNEGGGLWEER